MANMKEAERAEWFGAVLSLLYEFNWPMTEAEILKHSVKFSDPEGLRGLMSDLKRADLVADKIPGNWRLTKKGKDLVKQSLG